jgi:hypothetical protein
MSMICSLYVPQVLFVSHMLALGFLCAIGPIEMLMRNLSYSQDDSHQSCGPLGHPFFIPES